MPVRNALPYLDESIPSILDQTYRDFELIIRDDGSTDGSTEVLRRWAARDRRIRLFEGRETLGPAESSNWVVRQATAPIVARMDADDVSHPDRLRRQLAVLARHDDVHLVGALSEGIDTRSRRVRGRDRWRLARDSSFAPFPHGSIVFRRAVFDRVGGYRQACNYWEDLDLCLRFAAVGRVAVLADVLYRYRFSDTSTRLTSPKEQVEHAVDLMHRCVVEHEHGRPYDALIEAGDSPPAARLDPRVFFSIGSTRLWSGRPPHMLAGLFRRGALRWDSTTAFVIGWLVAAEATPRLLRRLLSAFVWLRDYGVRHTFDDGVAYDWRCGAHALDARPLALGADRTPEPSVDASG